LAGLTDRNGIALTGLVHYFCENEIRTPLGVDARVLRRTHT
jgi:hypothetical protein